MQKKIPQRTCMACQEKKDKRDLVRIVRSPEGEISVDLTGKKPGRGAYICPNLECTTWGVNSDVSYVLWMIIMGQCMFISCNKCTTLVGNADNAGGFACVTAGSV